MNETFEEWKTRVAPPLPPESLRGGVGPGDFWLRGFETASAISKASDLPRARRVVELGSGLGRVALPLLSAMPSEARYCGYDVAQPYVDWCKQEFAAATQAEFLHIDLANSQYNPRGSRGAHRARIPEKSGSVDMVFAVSLLTHLVPKEIGRYLAEASRMLRDGGTFFCTLFLVDEQTTPLIEAHETYPKFTTKIRHGYLANPESPGEGVAVDRTWFFDRAERAGLYGRKTQLGGWRGTDSYYQDIVVLRKG